MTGKQGNDRGFELRTHRLPSRTLSFAQNPQGGVGSCGLEGDYSVPNPPDDQQGLKELLARVRSGEITGLNVTIPHKQTVIPLLDELTPTAKRLERSILFSCKTAN
jgi:hypothetical protein